MVSVHRLQDPSDAQIEELTQLLLIAHDGLIVPRMMSDSRKDIEEKWHRSGVRIGALEGRIWVVYDPSYTPGPNTVGAPIVAVVVAFGPGAMPMASEAQRALGRDYFDCLSAEGKKWQNETFYPLMEKLVEESGGEEKVVDSWLTILLATDPVHQRKGYASALLREVKQAAVEDGSIVTLFTFSDELEAYYLSQGFTVEGKIDIPSPLGNWVHREMMWVNAGGAQQEPL
ncbi:hypothetical protein DFP72DRAFT_904907 [Ephemerocybe angulata]|uniref:N-acetyltransferase domain-containing protein n=1 Tax=Ephemerocybe angulata TaxID=980116 RepID=A0A8H6HU74_9AGAR|nr:hypothetical protein DFP72DRAFT_904907 [Tulosesus angulatus]